MSEAIEAILFHGSIRNGKLFEPERPARAVTEFHSCFLRTIISIRWELGDPKHKLSYRYCMPFALRSSLTAARSSLLASIGMKSGQAATEFPLFKHDAHGARMLLYWSEHSSQNTRKQSKVGSGENYDTKSQCTILLPGWLAGCCRRYTFTQISTPVRSSTLRYGQIPVFLAGRYHVRLCACV